MTVPGHCKASSFCPISHKCHSCFQLCLCVHNPEDGEESGGVCTNSQLHQHCTWAVFAGDHCVCAPTVPRQGSLSNLCSCSWTIHWPLRAFPRRLPSAKGGHNACHTGTSNTLFSPEDISRMCSFSRPGSLDTPIFSYHHVLYWANINSARDIVIS